MLVGQTPSDTLLYVDGVTVSFDGFKALNNLSLYVKSGEMRAIIGPNPHHRRLLTSTPAAPRAAGRAPANGWLKRALFWSMRPGSPSRYPTRISKPWTTI